MRDELVPWRPNNEPGFGDEDLQQRISMQRRFADRLAGSHAIDFFVAGLSVSNAPLFRLNPQ